MQFSRHSHFSDGEKGLEDYVDRAIHNGLLAYGCTDHAPIPGISVGMMDMDNLNPYLKKIDILKDQYKHKIQIYKSLEVDYIPNVISVDSAHIVNAELDYTLGAVHYVDSLASGIPWGFEASVRKL